MPVCHVGLSGGETNKMMIRKMTVKESREQILRIPEMFIGRQWNANGLYFLLFKIMKLAIEPEKANQCSLLGAIIESETKLSIIDNGRGLPVESVRIVKSVVRPKIEHVFSFMVTMHPTPAYYEDFGFLDYRAILLSAVSERLHIETYFEGQGYELMCVQGEIVDHLKPVADDVIQKGTRLTFTPDPIVFPDFKFDFESVHRGLNELKREYPAVSMTLEDKMSGQKIEIENLI